MTVSWWSSRTDIAGFAGQNIEVAVFYPEDNDYLIDRETTVTHYEVARTMSRTGRKPSSLGREPACKCIHIPASKS